MTNFSIGPSPIALVGAGVDNEPLTVQNTGTVSIYLSADPGVSPIAFEYKIDAGGDFTWPPGKSLSVCTGPGVIGQISYGGTGNVRVNSGSTNVTGAVTINGTVPISGPVTVSGSVALNAGSTVAIAGPVAIAGTVPISGNVNISGGTVALSGPVAINGGVNVTGSTVNVGTPVKLANNVTVISSFGIVIANGNLAAPTQGPYDITPYSSVIIKIFSSAPTSALLSSNWIDVFLTTTGTSSGDTYINPQFLASTGPTQIIQIPVTGKVLLINVTTHLTAYPNNGTIYFVIIGSGEVIPATRYLSTGDGMIGQIAQGGFFTRTQVTDGVTPSYVASKNGLATISAINAGVYGSNCRADILVVDFGNIVSLTGVASPPAIGGANIATILLPLRPLIIQIVTAAGGALVATCTQ